MISSRFFCTSVFSATPFSEFFTDPSIMSAVFFAEGMKKGDLSKFVEDAVRWRMLDRTVQAVKDRNQDIPAEMLEALIDEAVRDVRAAMHDTRR